MKSGALRLRDCYVLAGLHAAGNTVYVMCVYFWTRERFGFGPAENLLLGALQGTVYVACAAPGGRLAERFGYRATITAGLALMIATLLAAPFLHFHAAPFVISLLYTAGIAPTWPTLEAATMHVADPTPMPSRVGGYNVAWAAAGALAYFLSGPLFALNPDAVLWVPCLAHAAALAWLWLPRAAPPAAGAAAMDLPHGGTGLPRAVKRRFLYTAWAANALAYFLMTGFNALAPQLGERLGLSAAATIGLTSSQLIARAAAFFALQRWEGWHYHPVWGRAAFGAAPLLVGLMFFGGHPAVVLAAAVLFGIAVGLSYSGSLYYSLDYGAGKGTHSGLHESILGTGILGGPLVGAAGAAFGGALGGEWAVTAGGFALTLLAAAAVAVLSRRPPEGGPRARP